MSVALAAIVPGAAWAQAAPSADPSPPSSVFEPASSATSVVDESAAAPEVDDGRPGNETQGGALGEIVVTAQRRAENVQRTALSIAAVGGDALRTRGVTSADDLQKLVAGVQINGGATTQVHVRGIGDFGVTAVANPAVVTNLDGVVISRPQAISGNLYDIERVEVLRGPQGTLYGRNASGGAINIVTAQPKLGQFSGYVDANAGNYDQFGVEGAINLPIGDRAAGRISYQINTRDGYLTDGSDDDEHQSLRVQLKFEPSDALSIRAAFNATHLGGEGAGLTVVPPLPGLSRWTGVTSPAAGDAYIAAANAAFTASGGRSPPPFLLANPKSFDLFQDIDSYSGQLQVDYDLGFATLTFIPAYRRTNTRISVPTAFLYSLGGDYDAVGNRSDGERSDQYSGELRLGNDGSDLKWVVGVYGFQEDQSTEYSLIGGPILNIKQNLDLGTEAIAVFGQATYAILDNLRLTGGIRYTRDKRTAADFRAVGISPTVLAPAAITGLPPIPCLPETGSPPGTLCQLLNPTAGYYDSSTTFERVTWKAGFEADIGPESLLFGDVSTGFKAGGFNLAVSFTNPQALNSFRPETVTAYTLGIKNRFVDNRLQFNVEGFYLDYKNLQLSAQNFDGAGLVAIVTQNAGAARIFGANVDVVANPWRGGTLRAAVEYVDSKYEEFAVTQPLAFAAGRSTCAISPPDSSGLVTVDCSGKPLIRSPKWSGVVGFSQRFDLANGGSVTFDADTAFASSRILSTDFIPVQRVDGYANVGLSFTYRAPGDRWLIGAFVRNLANEAIYTGGGGTQSTFINGWQTSAIAPPRTYGARVRFQW